MKKPTCKISLLVVFICFATSAFAQKKAFVTLEVENAQWGFTKYGSTYLAIDTTVVIRQFNDTRFSAIPLIGLGTINENKGMALKLGYTNWHAKRKDELHDSNPNYIGYSRKVMLNSNMRMATIQFAFFRKVDILKKHFILIGLNEAFYYQWNNEVIQTEIIENDDKSDIIESYNYTKRPNAFVFQSSLDIDFNICLYKKLFLGICLKNGLEYTYTNGDGSVLNQSWRNGNVVYDDHTTSSQKISQLNPFIRNSFSLKYFFGNKKKG